MTVLYAKCSDIYMNEPYLIIATLNIEVKKKIKLYTSCNKYVTKVIFLDLKILYIIFLRPALAFL